MYLDRADAVLVPKGATGRPEWKGVSMKLLEGTPVLVIEPPEYVTGLWWSFWLRDWERRLG